MCCSQPPLCAERILLAMFTSACLDFDCASAYSLVQRDCRNFNVCSSIMWLAYRCLYCRYIQTAFTECTHLEKFLLLIDLSVFSVVCVQVYLFQERIQFLDRYTATPDQYLMVKDREGRVEHIPGWANGNGIGNWELGWATGNGMGNWEWNEYLGVEWTTGNGMGNWEWNEQLEMEWTTGNGELCKWVYSWTSLQWTPVGPSWLSCIKWCP